MKPRRPHPIRFAIPLASAAILAAVWFSNAMVPKLQRELVNAYHQRVEDRVLDIPVTVGSWTGRDVPAQREARELLDANIIRQLQYTDFDTGEVIQLLVVHCKDTRDMMGHYPPVCYPNVGWSYTPENDRELIRLSINGIETPAYRYRFTRFEGGVPRTMSVINFFVLPQTDGPGLYKDPDGINNASRDRRTARLGAANIQILSDRPLDPDGPVLTRFLEQLEPAVHAILEGAGNASPDAA